MLNDALVVSNGGGEKRFTTERDAPLSVGDIFEHEAESYRVLAIQLGHEPFDGAVEAEWLASWDRANSRRPEGLAALFLVCRTNAPLRA